MPEYVFQPLQLFRRLHRHVTAGDGASSVELPWGLAIGFASRDLLARALLRKRVHDPVLTETLWRLLDPGAVALDVGANIGYASGLMAARVGPQGAVTAFEPHPIVAAVLRANVARWSVAAGAAPITVRELALSNRSGVGELLEPPGWQGNQGVARVAVEDDACAAVGARHAIALDRLDDLLVPDARVDVMKVDVEGHEPAMFEGASATLRRRGIRDIVFEDLFTDPRAYPTPAVRLLQGFGYTVFGLAKRFRGPALGRADRSDIFPKNPGNLLATLDPARARARLRPRGWLSLRGTRNRITPASRNATSAEAVTTRPPGGDDPPAAGARPAG